MFSKIWTVHRLTTSRKKDKKVKLTFYLQYDLWKGDCAIKQTFCSLGFAEGPSCCKTYIHLCYTKWFLPLHIWHLLKLLWTVCIKDWLRLQKLFHYWSSQILHIYFFKATLYTWASDRPLFYENIALLFDYGNPLKSVWCLTN